MTCDLGNNITLGRNHFIVIHRDTIWILFSGDQPPTLARFEASGKNLQTKPYSINSHLNIEDSKYDKCTK